MSALTSALLVVALGAAPMAATTSAFGAAAAPAPVVASESVSQWNVTISPVSTSDTAVRGTATPGVKLTVWGVDGLVWSTPTVGLDGTWGIEDLPLWIGQPGATITAEARGEDGEVVATATATLLEGIPEAPDPSKDTSAPSVPGSFSAGITSDNRSVKVAWTASTDEADGSGLRGYQVFKDGELFKYVDAPAVGATLVNIDPTADGEYKVRAIDKAGNLSAFSAPTTISGDTSAPSVPGSFSAGITSDNRSVKVAWTASTDEADGSGLRGYQVFKDGELFKYVDAPAVGATLVNIDPTADGEYKVRAIDKAGNLSAFSAPTTIPGDTSVPSVPGAQSEAGESGPAVINPVKAGDRNVTGTVPVGTKTVFIEYSKWSWTPVTPAADGSFQVPLKQVYSVTGWTGNIWTVAADNTHTARQAFTIN